MLEDQVIENELESELPAENEPVNTSVRDELQKAFKEVAEKPELKEKTSKSAKPRAEDGKFAKGEKPVIDKNANAKDFKPLSAGAETPTVEKTVSAPQSWSAAAKAKFNDLPPELKAEIGKREDEIHKGFTKFDEERNFGKQLKDVINPYMPQIQAQGFSAPAVVQSLLNSAYILRTGSAEQKLGHMREIANSYGIDLSGLAQQQNSQVLTDPSIAALQNEIAQLRGVWTQEQAQKQQQESGVINSTIGSFAADTEAHPHFETVKAHMAALLKGGLAKGNTPLEFMQDAYDQAVNAHPEIRSTLQESKLAELDAKRLQESKDKAAAARRAGSSIKGSPGLTVPAQNKTDLSLRDELRANIRAAVQH